jgi:hypothetical protein
MPFSKVFYIVTLGSKYTRALKFKNVCQDNVYSLRHMCTLYYTLICESVCQDETEWHRAELTLRL